MTPSLRTRTSPDSRIASGPRGIPVVRSRSTGPGALVALALLTLLLMVGSPADVGAQSVSRILSGLRDGGGWVGIPIENGKGTYSTVRLPTARMTLEGCVNVWYGHSGKWTIEARDAVTDSLLVIDAEPGIGVPFSHTFGMQAQIDFDFRWSEPRDTTLMLWVGVDLDGEGGEPAVCNPY